MESDHQEEDLANKKEENNLPDEEDIIQAVPVSDRVEVLRREGFNFVYLPTDVDWSDVDWQKQSELKELFMNPGLTIFFSPGRRETLERFFTEYPKYSIALDGFVPGLYHFQTEEDGGPRVVMDHHMNLRDLGVEGFELDRTILRSTCEQVFRRVWNGFFRKHFGVVEDGDINLNVFIEDLDEDVILSIYNLYRLVNPHSGNGGKQKARLRSFFRLVNHEGIKDADGGSFAFGGEGFEGPDPHEEDEKLKWTFVRLADWKENASLRELSAAGMCGYVVEDTFHRIDEYIDGRAGRMPLDGRYEVLFDDPAHRWCLVSEHGHEARMKMAEDGIGAIISHIREGARGDVFTLWKIDDASSWPALELYDVFNRMERVRVDVQKLLRQKWQGKTFQEHFSIASDLLGAKENDARFLPDHPRGVGTWGISERGGGSPRDGTWMWQELLAALAHVYIDHRQQEKKENVSPDSVEDQERKEGEKLFRRNGGAS